MIESYSIGVTAKLLDLVSPALDRMIKTFGVANDEAKLLNRTLDQISRQTAGMRLLQASLVGVELGFKRATKAAEGFGGSAGAATRASYAMDEMALASNRMARHMASARLQAIGIREEMNGAIPRMPRGGGGSAADDAPGRGARGAGYAGAGFMWGVYENAKVDDIVARAVATDGLAPGQRAGAAESYRNRILGDYGKYGFAAHGVEDVANAYLSSSRLMRGMPVGERMRIIDQIMPYAAAEAKLKDISINEATSSFVGAAHMSGAYSAKDIKHMLPALISASLASNANMAQIERAAGYAVPILRTGMGIDPAKTFTMLAIMQRAGITNTKSGTWIADLFMNAVPKNLGAGLLKNTNQVKALQALGLMHGKHLTYLDKAGNLDPLKMLAILGNDAAHSSKIQLAGNLKQAFGMQGARAAALFSDAAVQSMVPMLVNAIKQLEHPKDTLNTIKAGNAKAQAKATIANANLTLMNATATFMGPVNAALNASSGFFADSAAFTKRHPLIGGAGALAGLGATGILLGSLWKGGGKLADLLLKRVETGVAGAVGWAFKQLGPKAMLGQLIRSGAVRSLAGTMADFAAGTMGAALAGIPMLLHATSTVTSAQEKKERARLMADPNSFYNQHHVTSLPHAKVPIQVHTTANIHVDGKKIGEHLLPAKNLHGSTAPNPSHYRPSPAGAGGHW